MWVLVTVSVAISAAGYGLWRVSLSKLKAIVGARHGDLRRDVPDFSEPGGYKQFPAWSQSFRSALRVRAKGDHELRTWMRIERFGATVMVGGLVPPALVLISLVPL